MGIVERLGRQPNPPSGQWLNQTISCQARQTRYTAVAAIMNRNFQGSGPEGPSTILAPQTGHEPSTVSSSSTSRSHASHHGTAQPIRTRIFIGVDPKSKASRNDRST